MISSYLYVGLWNTFLFSAQQVCVLCCPPWCLKNFCWTGVKPDSWYVFITTHSVTLWSKTTLICLVFQGNLFTIGQRGMLQLIRELQARGPLESVWRKKANCNCVFISHRGRWCPLSETAQISVSDNYWSTILLQWWEEVHKQQGGLKILRSFESFQFKRAASLLSHRLQTCPCFMSSESCWGHLGCHVINAKWNPKGFLASNSLSQFQIHSP